MELWNWKGIKRPLPLDKGRLRGIRLVDHPFQIPPDPPFLKWGKDFHIHLVLQSSIAGLFWKLSQDSMLIVTPECFYQGSKGNGKNYRFLINTLRNDGVETFGNDGWKTSLILETTQDFSLRRKMKKIRNKMHTLGERIQEYGVRISSFYFFQLNTSTSQQLNILVFPYSHGAAIATWRSIL